MKAVLRVVFAGLFLATTLLNANRHATAIPAEWVKELIYVPCSIGDSGPLRCLLDTGSMMTGVSPELAAKLKIKAHPGGNVARADLVDRMLDPIKVRLGDFDWTAEPASLSPTELEALDQESGAGMKTDVLIGTSLFQHYQVTIDPEAKEVRLATPGSPPPEGAEKEPLLVVSGIAILGISVKSRDGHAQEAPFTVDTGSRPPLLLGRNYWDSHPPLAVSFAPESDHTLLRVAAIRLGRFELDNAPAAEPNNGTGILAVKSLGGVVGAPILNRFVITYDFSQSALWVRPSAEFGKSF